jgi:hypothetical protein
MRLFGRRNRSGEPDSRLIGRWLGQVGGEPVEMAFEPDGRLLYVIHSAGKQQVMLLTWTVDGHALVTDQPSDPRPERTAFRWDGPTLILAFGGVETRFTRGDT